MPKISSGAGLLGHRGMLQYRTVMATCPTCGQFLGEQHQCPGAWRRSMRRIGVALVGAAIGGAVPMLLSTNSVHPLVIVVAALLGALLATALRQATPY